MPSNHSILPYSPYLPHDLQSDASESPWSASSNNTGSAYESLTLPPINPDLGFDFYDGEQYYDSLPRLQSPDPYLPGPSSSRSQEQQPPPSNQQARQQQPSRRRSEYEVEGSESPDPFEEFVEPNFEYLPSPRREAQNRSQNTTRASSVVDLTESSPPPDTMAPNKKRKAETPVEGRSVRQRVHTHTPPQSSRSTPPSRVQKVENVDVVDLVDIEDDDQYADFKAKQQAEAIRQQQQDEAKKPVKLAEFQCIICMDNPTDLTVTHCGHLFCSECLHQALYAGNAKKCCPVCRTAINTTMFGKGDQKRQPKNGIFALEMKLMTANKKGKQPVKSAKSVSALWESSSAYV